MTINERTATCSCGGLRVECIDEPERITACNCSQCQRRTGSVFGVAAYYLQTKINLKGDYKRYKRSSDAGRYVENYFCPACGTTVAWNLEVFPDLTGVAVGCFADKNFGKPARAVWTSQKHEWVQFPEDIPHFEMQLK
jgi:hypothetical protein